MDTKDVPVDFVVSQSIPTGARVPSESEVDILVSRGSRTKSYIMPDVIGRGVEEVEEFFDNWGLKIAERKKISYPGLQSGIIIGQYPSSGFQINIKSRIRIEVSE